jgi:uncharacterized membrane protein YccC
MGLAALGIGMPLIIGVAVDQVVAGVFLAIGGMVASTADRAGPYRLRVGRVACAGIIGGAGGLLVGEAVNGRGWVTVAVMIGVAWLSAVLSSISSTWSTTGMFLLVYAALATGPLGAVTPWWLPPLWVVAGVFWRLLLMVPGWLRGPRAVEHRQVAEVYRALAANLRALGTEGLAEARRAVSAALNLAHKEVLGQRGAERGRDPRLVRLVALLNQARLVADAAAALATAGERPPPHVAEHADALAAAVLSGEAVSGIEQPSAASPALLAAHRALNGATELVSGGRVDDPDAEARAIRSAYGRRSRHELAELVRESLASTFTIRLVLCIGVAAVISETLPLQRSYWVVLAVAVVMKPDFGSVFARALQYAAGTVMGAIVGGLILLPSLPQPALLAPMVVFAALMIDGMSRNYGLFGVFFTPVVVLLVDLLVHGGWRLAEARLIDILVGCAIVLCIGYAPWPSSWHAHLPRAFAGALRAIADYLDEAVAERAPGMGARAHAHARGQLPALRVEFQRALAEPRRVRDRVMSWYPAVVALEQLVEAVTATVVTAAAQPPPSAVRELSSRLRRIAATVETGAPPQPEARLDATPSLRSVGDALRCLELALTARPGPRAFERRTADDHRTRRHLLPRRDRPTAL